MLCFGIRQISGAGGQLDFVMGAYLSNGGKSFVCLSSTFTNKKGETFSRILPTLHNGSVVTDTRSNAHYIVTEYGMANLKGKSTWESCRSLDQYRSSRFQRSADQRCMKLLISGEDSNK